MEKKSKLIIIVRNDLKMPCGKIVAQTGHAVLGSIFNQFKDYDPNDSDWYFRGEMKPDWMEKHLILREGSALEDWVNGEFTKVTLKVDTEKDFHLICEIAEDAGLPVVKIKDNGRTVFKEPTWTCAAIGPAWDIDVDCITGDLKLL